MTVRPKDRGGLSARQRPFVRSSVIVRSQTFSPGERSQYICRVGAQCCTVGGAPRLGGAALPGVLLPPRVLLRRRPPMHCGPRPCAPASEGRSMTVDCLLGPSTSHYEDYLLARNDFIKYTKISQFLVLLAWVWEFFFLFPNLMSHCL